jgi:uncharacterized protein YegP (UPF0339 family)
MAGNRPYPSFLIYLDDKGEFRWIFDVAREQTLAVGAKGYRRVADCEAAIEQMKQSRSAVVWVTQDAAAKRR